MKPLLAILILLAATAQAQLAQTDFIKALVGVQQAYKPPASGGTNADTTLLLWLTYDDQADASTNVVDSSSYARPASVLGNAQIDTAIVKIGNGSLKLDGTGDKLSFPDDAVWAFGTNNWNFSTWFRWNTQVKDIYLFGQNGGGIVAGGLYQGAGVATALTFRIYNGSWRICTNSAYPSYAINTWYHFSLDCHDQQMRGYLNGIQMGDPVDPGTVGNGAGLFMVGDDSTGDENPLNGYLDEVQVRSCSLPSNVIYGIANP